MKQPIQHVAYLQEVQPAIKKGDTKLKLGQNVKNKPPTAKEKSCENPKTHLQCLWDRHSQRPAW